MKKVKPKFVKVCPNCGSLDIEVRKDSNVDYSFGLPVIYHCNKCNLENYVFPEINLNEKKQENKNEKHGAKPKKFGSLSQS